MRKFRYIPRMHDALRAACPEGYMGKPSTVKVKPATLRDVNRAAFNERVRRATAYPRLVEALRDCIEVEGVRYWPETERAIALLRELGEES